MATINKIRATPVPNGPLIKKKGEFKGSTLKSGGKIKKAQNGTSAKKDYDEKYKNLKEARDAVGRNDTAKLNAMGLGSRYNNNDLTRDYNAANQARKKAGLGSAEEAKLTLPHVGQQLRGTVNQMLGTHLKSGGKVKKNWIQKAVNPAHKGFCTPMTKATCTPKRKALAKTFKAMGRARKAK